MTNFERYFSEIKEIILHGSQIAIENGNLRQCKGLPCSECFFGIDIENQSCGLKMLTWLTDEYVEPYKLTHKQLAILKILETGWLARDDTFSKNLYWYSEKPTRCNNHFENANCGLMWVRGIFDAFDFITFKDGPYSVEEMLTWEVENDKF